MCLSSLAFLIYLLYFYFQAPKVVKKGIAKKIAAVPAAMKKRVEKEKIAYKCESLQDEVSQTREQIGYYKLFMAEVEIRDSVLA